VGVISAAETAVRVAVPVPGRWTFWADLIVDRQPLGYVDVSSFYAVARLSNWGYGNFTVALPCGIDPDRLLRLWSWRLWAMYDGEPWWCGVPTGLADESGRTTAQFTATELPGYLTKRVFDQYPKWDTRTEAPDGMEQCEIARRLAAPLADVGVPVITQPDTPVLRDRTYEYLESEHRAQLLSNLAGVLDGPEFRSEYGWTPEGLPLCSWRVGYPRIGTDSGLGVTIPGAALEYRALWDSDRLRTMTFAVGDLPDDAPPETPRPVATVDRPQPDLPRLDAVDDWPGTVLPGTLAERARTAATQQAAPALQLSATPPSHVPAVTGYRVGDTVTLRAQTPLVPGGLEVSGRLAMIEVNAADNTAVWTVITSSPPPVPRATLAGELSRLGTSVASMFRSGRLAPAPAPPAGEDEGR
jgi:hypothetical protein